MDYKDTYETKRVNEEFYIKNFVLHYKKYIDYSLAKLEKDRFNAVLDRTRSEVLKVKNIEKNTLFVCSSNISKYVFLAAFSRLPRLVSNRYMNFLEILDIWNNNSNSENVKKPDDEQFNSEQDIREDVLCIYIDQEMLTDRRCGKIVNSVLTSRSDRVNKRLESLYTWIFYRGTMDNLKDDVTISPIYELFKSDPLHYQIIDLCDLNSVMGNDSNIKTDSVKSLKDIY